MIRKEGCDAKTLKIALGLAFIEFMAQLKEYAEYESFDGEELHYEANGRHIYDGTGILFKEFSAQEISEKLGCTVEVHYEGEDKEDAERLEYVDGKLTKHRQLRWVDVE